MDIQQERHGILSGGAPYRLPGWSSATEGEARNNSSTATDDGGTVPAIPKEASGWMVVNRKEPI